MLKYKLPQTLCFYDLLTVLYEIDLTREAQVKVEEVEEKVVPDQPRQFVLRHRVFEVEKKKVDKRLRVLHGLNYRALEYIRLL